MTAPAESSPLADLAVRTIALQDNFNAEDATAIVRDAAALSEVDRAKLRTLVQALKAVRS